MPYKDFREFIETLEAQGQLKRVKKEVDWNLELSHVAKINEARGRGEALLFENVKDYPGKRVAINLVNTREKVALALGLAHPQPVMTVKAIHYRNDPILWASLAGMPVTDTHVLQTVARTAGIWNELQNMGIPGIKAMYLPPMAGGRMIAIVSIEQLYPGHSTQVGLAIFTTTPGNYGLKMVVVVDSDIDPENWDQVIYALGFRYQPDRGTQIIQRGRATPLDPSIPKGERLFTSRVLIDACYPWEWKEKPVTVVLDEETRNKVEARWDEYLAP